MMLLTSSRKPSFKTKILCKKLALFCDAAYMTRGKMSMSEVLERGNGTVLCIVGEYHGNPGSLSFYDPSGCLFLSLRFSETSFEPVPQAELRYGDRIFYGSESSPLFRLLNMFTAEDKGAALPQDIPTELFNRHQKDVKRSKDIKTEDTTADDMKTDSVKDVQLPGPIRAVSWISEDGPDIQNKSTVYNAYVRRLYIQEDRLDFYSNDRLFLRLYIKGTKIEMSD